MAVGLTGLPVLHPVDGVRLAAQAAGVRYKNRTDLVLIECARGTTAAAVFTRNRFCAAPVVVARDHLAKTAPRALLINSGNANAGTGAQGERDARVCCDALAPLLGCDGAAVLPFSTGVIGERLPAERIVAVLPEAVADLRADAWDQAAMGIMTTDTVPKGASRRASLGGGTVTITGIAKGAGMIRPDMATMLAFVATDAVVDAALLQRLVAEAAQASFNRITVDGDTSTNDACVLLATGRSGVAVDAGNDEELLALGQGVTGVMTELAQAIIRDAEGATKFITVEVSGGANDADCLEVAYTIAHSPLVKTAFFASDPNWGRILAAVGRAPIAGLDAGAVSIYLDDLQIVAGGMRDSGYTEQAGQEVMQRAEITLRVELGGGPGKARVWTSDLSHDYVRINAEYRT
jgi:glutamate N-acetyltransferase/amino-acid N-acetyltransferase